MESWPTQLPEPVVEPYGFEVSPSLVRTEMDSGFIRQRQRFTQQLRSFSVAFSFTDVELALFQAWWKYKIASGADWFLMSINIGGEKSPRQIRFASPFTTTTKGGRWTVKATMETMNDSPMTESQLNLALGLSA